MKKIVSLILVAVFIISVLPLQVIAKDLNKIDFYMSASLEGGKFNYDLSDGRHATAKSYYGSFPLTGKYYDQLTSVQKEVYNALIASDITDETVDITFSSPVMMPQSDSNWDTISNIIFAAFFAALRDYPERFWYNSVRWGSNNAWYSGNNIAVGGATVTIGFHSSYSASTITDVYNQLMTVVNAFTPAGVTRYEKIRSIHDYLVNLATYDPNYNNASANPYGHQPTGCLLSPNLCVCEGYAEAFKIFADREGIPNMLVTSATHIWNVILMEDNKWYALDCTWDDPMTESSNKCYLCYDYFLVGSQTVPAGESEAFSQQEDHVEEYCFTDTNGISLINPPLNTTSYAPFYPKYTYHTNGVSSNDYPGGSVLQTKSLIFICPGKTLTGCFDFNSYGTYTNNGGNKTGATLKFTPTGGTATNYTVVMRGDVNKDAAFNSTDLTYVGDISVGTRTFSATAPETYAGDCNGDGVVDGFDLALLDRYQNGSYSFY